MGVSGASRFFPHPPHLLHQHRRDLGVEVSRITWRSNSSATCRASHELLHTISAESPYLWPHSHQRLRIHCTAISWQLCPRRYLLPNFCLSGPCLEGQVSRMSATSATPMFLLVLFRSGPTISHHPIQSNHIKPLKRDATAQIPPMFQLYKIHHLGFHVCGLDLNHLLTKSRCSKVCGLLDKAPTSKGLLLRVDERQLKATGRHGY